MWLYIEPEELLPSEDQKCGRPTVGQMTKSGGFPKDRQFDKKLRPPLSSPIPNRLTT